MAQEEAEASGHAADLSDKASTTLSDPLEHQIEEDVASAPEAEHTDLNVTGNGSESSNKLTKGVESTASQTPDAAVNRPGDVAQTDDIPLSMSSEVSSFQPCTIAEQWML